jgi:hypothetical protein
MISQYFIGGMMPELAHSVQEDLKHSPRSWVALPAATGVDVIGHFL